MKILVDADACPVKDIVIKVAKIYNIEIIMFIDTSHILSDDYCQIITVDKGRDSVDIRLINKAEKGDIVVTQDYGLASLALGKKVYAINQNGFEYTDYNIDKLLLERHLSQKSRQAGIKTKNIKKRSKEDDKKFEERFSMLCERLCSLTHKA